MTPLRPTALAPAVRPEADAAPPASDARECPICPRWTLACAHWDGKGVALVGLHGTRHDTHSLAQFYKFSCYSIEFRHNCPQCGDVCVPATTPAFYRGDDYDAALRAFRDAEVRLISGGLEG